MQYLSPACHSPSSVSPLPSSLSILAVHAVVRNTIMPEDQSRNHNQTPVPLQPQTSHTANARPLVSSRSLSASSELTMRAPALSDNRTRLDRASHASPRVAVPLPFSDVSVTNSVDFCLRGRRGVNLAEWARLAEKRKTYLALDDPHDGVDELFSCEDGTTLFQSHWPGYDTRTCYLEMPALVTEGERPFTKVNLLDMVCQLLVDWVVKVMNRRHIECRDPRWSIGLKQITFKHIYVTSVVNIRGYVSKWVPVLEIDSQAFKAHYQL